MKFFKRLWRWITKLSGHCCHRHHRIPSRIYLNIELVSNQLHKKETHMNVSTTMNDAQAQVAHIVVKDKAGQVDATTVADWTSSDATLITVTLDANDATGRTATLTAAGPPGQATVTATCGAATLVIAVAITASADVDIEATFDAPTDK